MNHSTISRILCLGMLAITPAISRADVTSLPDIIKALQGSEGKLLNLTVEGASYEDEMIERPDGKDEWRPTSVCIELKMWHNGLIGGPIRVDVDKLIAPWRNGAAPFYQMRYSQSFDGVEGRHVDLQGGAEGHAADVSEGGILPKRPSMASEMYGDGRYCSIYFYREDLGKSLSQYISDQFKILAPFKDGIAEVTKEKYQGLDSVRVRVGREPFIVESWWLDPARGYALLKYVHEWENSTKKEGFDVLKIDEIGKGIWYPTEAVRTLPKRPPDDLTVRRWRYSAKSAVANDPKFDDTIFKIAFPSGFHVTDESTHREYIAAPTTQKLSADLEDALRNAQTTQPATRPTEVHP